MKTINSYLVEKLVIDKNVNKENSLIRVLKDFTKSDLTPELIERVNKFIDKRNIDEYYFIVYKGKKPYNRLSQKIKDQINVTIIDNYDEWIDDILPKSFDWTYNGLINYQVLGTNECLLIRYNVGLKDTIHLCIKKNKIE